MMIKIDDIKDNSIDDIINALDKYIDNIKNNMFNPNEINNVFDEEDTYKEVIGLINNYNDIVNSYIDNNLESFKESLIEFKKYKMEK